MEKLPNQLKTHRISRGWSQAELAQRAGISRAAVSAIEINRLVPSVAAALGLAQALGCSVEDLFTGNADQPKEALWAWPPSQDSCRYWHATLGGRTLLYPVETTAAGILEHDGVYQKGVFRTRSRFDPQQTLVVAGCDPAAALLAAEVCRLRGLRVIPLPRSSQHALALLGQGLVHVAGLHLATSESPDINVRAVQDRLGPGFRLLRVAQWQEGIALSPGSAVRTVQAAMRSKLRWIGREPGSGARQCLDDLLGRRPPPRRVAPDHRGVAEAIRCGWGDAGVCLQLVSEEAGLRFLTVRKEIYELCFASESEGDPRIHALKETVRSASYPNLLDDLPGYEASECGEMQTVPFT
jgi:molybdate-binding protein/DNA-binding XRE family transcriptional regulator